MALVRALQAAQYSLLAVCVFGDQIFRFLGVAAPQLYVQNVVPNRFGAVMGIWFVGNMMINTLQQTGAFEVYFDGQLVRGWGGEGVAHLARLHRLLLRHLKATGLAVCAAVDLRQLLIAGPTPVPLPDPHGPTHPPPLHTCAAWRMQRVLAGPCMHAHARHALPAAAAPRPTPGVQQAADGPHAHRAGDL